LKEIIKNEYSLNINQEKEKEHYINQQDNQLFRQIRLITGKHNQYNPYVVFVNCVGCKTWKDELSLIIKSGFSINHQHFVLTEKSSSMSRNAILGFVDETIFEELDKRITMDIQIKKTVLSKYLSYRGLMFSSCFCIENWVPKIIIVPDYIKVSPNQHVKHTVDAEREYIDQETGEKKIWIEKDVTETTMDIELNVADGCGIHHPLITLQIKEFINIINENPTSVMWRMPYIKGMTHEFNYTDFYNKKGIQYIKDIWGVQHDIDHPMVIFTESMYKGLKYFQNNNNISDWEMYWKKFYEYNHCIGIAKWNYDISNEPVYTRVNYQILQDLNLHYDDFSCLANDSIEWAYNILKGDPVYTYCFLGLFADNQKPVNDYMRAILKDSNMLKQENITEYFNSLLKKYIDEFKCGKLWLKSSFRILIPDLVMLAEFIAGLEPVGCLKSGEFFSQGIDGVCEGEHLIERNPHIAHSEHVILNGAYNDIINKYCKNLYNTVMINGYDVIDARLNGSDKDKVGRCSCKMW
jgi:hypothetical protein